MKIAVFDLDMTISDGYSGADISAEFEKANLIKPGFIAGQAKIREDYFSGKIDYNDVVSPLNKLIEETYKGADFVEIRKFIKEEYQPEKKIYEWVPDLFDYLHKKDYLIAIVSGSFDFYVEALQDILDFDTFYASSYEVEGGLFTGKNNFFVNDVVKATYVKQIANGNFTIVVGDSKGDEDMMKVANKAFYLLDKNSRNLSEKPDLEHVEVVTHDDIMQKISAAV
jgi:HAD superfamily phosphoserine phosphatase-like hydrolase